MHDDQAFITPRRYECVLGRKKMRVKHWFWGAAVLCGAQMTVHAEMGVYVELACRKNDPFVFCTQGCKDQDRNWIPIDPISGTWTAAPGYCPFESPIDCWAGAIYLGKAWTLTAIAAVKQYESICPAAERQGDWKGSGRPESTPFDH